jgi:hypothetical protein
VDGHLERAGELAAPEALDDTVDVLIAFVLEAGGDAMFLEPGLSGSTAP